MSYVQNCREVYYTDHVTLIACFSFYCFAALLLVVIVKYIFTINCKSEYIMWSYLCAEPEINLLLSNSSYDR